MGGACMHPCLRSHWPRWQRRWRSPFGSWPPADPPVPRGTATTTRTIPAALRPTASPIGSMCWWSWQQWTTETRRPRRPPSWPLVGRGDALAVVIATTASKGGTAATTAGLGAGGIGASGGTWLRRGPRGPRGQCGTPAGPQGRLPLDLGLEPLGAALRRGVVVL